MKLFNRLAAAGVAVDACAMAMPAALSAPEMTAVPAGHKAFRARHARTTGTRPSVSARAAHYCWRASDA